MPPTNDSPSAMHQEAKGKPCPRWGFVDHDPNLLQVAGPKMGVVEKPWIGEGAMAQHEEGAMVSTPVCSWTAVSIGHRNSLSIRFAWRPPSEGFSRSSIEAVRDFYETRWIDGIEVDAARKVLA